MSEQQETIYADGLMFTKKHDNAPDFVLGGISIKVEDFKAFLDKHKKADGWVNLDMLRGKDKTDGSKGRPYFKLNTWKKPEDSPASPEDKSNIPF